jgi:hypothetical protein
MNIMTTQKQQAKLIKNGRYRKGPMTLPNEFGGDNANEAFWSL